MSEHKKIEGRLFKKRIGYAHSGALNDIDNAILDWQQKQKKMRDDVSFNAKRYLAVQLGYRDEHIIYRFLDPNNSASAKFGIEYLIKIMFELNDFTPIENLVKNVKDEYRSFKK
jgi:hypothetical protein